MDLITHFLVPYIILTLVKSKNRLAGAFGGISLDFDTIFVSWIGILFPQLFIFSHRGITHSFFFAFFTSLIFLFVISRKQVSEFIGKIIRRDLNIKFTEAAIITAYFGAVTHLMLDFLTTKGIPLFYPLSITRYAAELYPAIDIVITIAAALTLLILYLRLNPNYKKAAMAIFIIILVSLGGIRTYEKINVLEAETPTLNGTYSQISVYPTGDVFTWNVVKSNAQNSSYMVLRYNTRESNESDIRTFKSPLIENGSYSSAQDAINIANTLPTVERFKWDSYYALIDAKYNSPKWDITYYDILNSWTGGNLTVSINT